MILINSLFIPCICHCKATNITDAFQQVRYSSMHIYPRNLKWIHIFKYKKLILKLNLSWNETKCLGENVLVDLLNGSELATVLIINTMRNERGKGRERECINIS